MSMNEVTLSGIVTSELSDTGNDGVMLTLTVSQGGGAGEDRQDEEFTCLAYGNTAGFLKGRNLSSGDRLVFQGRLGSDKLGTEKYHSAITITRVLGVGNSEDGTDVALITVSGEGEIQDLRNVGAKDTSLVPIRLTNKREFTNKNKESFTYTTYVNGSVWAARADRLSPHEGTYPNIILNGLLRSRTYEDKDGDTISKIDVWVNDVYEGNDLLGGEAHTPEPVTKTPSAPQQAQRKRRASSVDADPF